MQEKGKADMRFGFLFSGERQWQNGRGRGGLVLVTMALMKVCLSERNLFCFEVSGRRNGMEELTSGV